MTEILNAHGAKNDIFLMARTPHDFASDADLLAFVRRLCDRQGPFGGDGIYLYDPGLPVPQAWFFNPDGSAAEFCGNGMRCLGRVILDLRGQDAVTIRSGPREYTVRRGPTTPGGVRQVRLEHPPVDFAPLDPVVAGLSPAVEVALPELDPALAFTAVTIPNPHLIALVDKYVESDLVAMGKQVAARPERFPAGANLSVLLPLAPHEVFVRTFERGAGLTASCGSGMAAARAVYSRLGRADPEREVVVRNAGGVATASLRVRDGQWFPVLQGNATFVYRADVDPAALARIRPTEPEPAPREPFPDEISAYAAADEENAARLRAAGIETAIPDLPRANPAGGPGRVGRNRLPGCPWPSRFAASGQAWLAACRYGWCCGARPILAINSASATISAAVGETDSRVAKTNPRHERPRMRGSRSPSALAVHVSLTARPGAAARTLSAAMPV
jgi:diaminopimelate epimerase